MSLAPKRLSVKKKVFLGRPPVHAPAMLDELRRRMSMRDVQEAMASRENPFDRLVSPKTITLGFGEGNRAVRRDLAHRIDQFVAKFGPHVASPQPSRETMGYDLQAMASSSQYEVAAATRKFLFGRPIDSRLSPDLPESALSLYTKQDINDADEFRNLLMADSTKVEQGHEEKQPEPKRASRSQIFRRMESRKKSTVEKEKQVGVEGKTLPMKTSVGVQGVNLVQLCNSALTDHGAVRVGKAGTKTEEESPEPCSPVQPIIRLEENPTPEH